MKTRSALPAIIVSVLCAWAPVGSHVVQRAAAASATLYVDGKHGSDANSGDSWGNALRTINHAARQVPHGAAAAGWTVVVRGFTDYIYRERPVPGGYDRWGTASAPLVFSAEGWTAGGKGYVKPIVSGGIVAPKEGNGWLADVAAGVWHTRWSQPPAGFDPKKPFSSAIYQNGTRRLWQHASLADLRAQASTGNGGYWYDGNAGQLYVATRKGLDPASVQIEVPTRKGFYFEGSAGASWISVRGFVVQHAVMGIAFYLGADDNSALDNVGIGNTPMSFATSGRVTGSGSDPAIGNVFRRNSATFSTLQGFKVDAGSQDTVICRNKVRHNGLQGIKVQGPAAAGDPRETRGVEICRNVLANQDVRRSGAGREDEQPNGLTISNGVRDAFIHHNTIRGNTVGVQVNQRGAGAPISNTRFRRNVVSNNRSVGLNLRDGVADRRDGTGSLSGRYNVYAANGVGIRVHPGSTNKSFDHETVYGSTGFGIQIGCGCSSSSSSVRIATSLVTHNGSYGIRIAPGQDVHISYLGLPSNASGATSGSVVRDHLNARAAGYLSRDPRSSDFLRIGPASFQYTAGPGTTPIGARS